MLTSENIVFKNSWRFSLHNWWVWHLVWTELKLGLELGSSVYNRAKIE